MEDVLISGFASTYLLDDYLLIKDNRAPDKIIHLFNKNTFQHGGISMNEMLVPVAFLTSK